MKRLFVLIILVFCYGCSKKSFPEDQKQWVDGYWEIEKVLFKGEKKEYTISSTIDFIYLETPTIGYRKKVTPTLNGKFLSNENQSAIELIIRNDSLFIVQKNKIANWEDYVKKADSLSMILQNDRGLQYYYKRYEPLNLGNEKTQ